MNRPPNTAAPKQPESHTHMPEHRCHHHHQHHHYHTSHPTSTSPLNTATKTCIYNQHAFIKTTKNCTKSSNYNTSPWQAHRLASAHPSKHLVGFSATIGVWSGLGSGLLMVRPTLPSPHPCSQPCTEDYLGAAGGGHHGAPVVTDEQPDPEDRSTMEKNNNKITPNHKSEKGPQKILETKYPTK